MHFCIVGTKFYIGTLIDIDTPYPLIALNI